MAIEEDGGVLEEANPALSPLPDKAARQRKAQRDEKRKRAADRRTGWTKAQLNAEAERLDLEKEAFLARTNG